ncbi:DUF6328 family protein [Streptomyces sp. B-S-A8]|uniref:DUF6328 family protein n=1 Tax=Streptomyces solicavernae TaxID=3043614 RepID=A0ABT6RUB9_9ACTN|nr:DUF6328 family protein [Streptomyces sp. B-S-A8]MDI3388019.1 DUF6328 family protein [Streptomyces sp. B-S-A8]
MADDSRKSDRNETPFERADRNFGELLQELRVVQVGVQILFAFLLTLAFTSRFRSLDDLQRGTYVATLLLSVAAAALFTAPAAVHRALFRRHAKPQIVRVSSRLAAIGMAVLCLALTGSVLLVVDVALGRTAGVTCGVGTFLMCFGLWGVLPRMIRTDGGNEPAAPENPDAPERARPPDSADSPDGPDGPR